MKIAIIYICTGKYELFWKNFIQSSEQYFFKGYEKKYFVFTDSEAIMLQKNKNVQVYYRKKAEWPYDTLLRWNAICEIQDLLMQYEYIFFCNANMKFLDAVDCNLLHPKCKMLVSFSTKENSGDSYTLERRMESKAYIPLGTPVSNYVRGGFIGDCTEGFLNMARTLRDWTAEDLSNGIIPVWHDESMLNAYMLHKKYSLWPDGVVMPEELKKENTKIIFRDKCIYGGNASIREYKERKIPQIVDKAKRLLRKIHKE